MVNFRGLQRLGLLLLMAALVIGCTRQIVKLNDGQPVEFEGMMGELKGARVIFVGEAHDEEAHHQAQLDIIRALDEKGIPLAIGLEMFPAENQRYLDHWVAGRLDAGSFKSVFMNNWKVNWWFYEDIFLYARDHKIPLIGLNIPKPIMHKVYTQGFAALSEQERHGLPVEISCDSSDPYTAKMRKFYKRHSSNTGTFDYFCEAQTLWNRGMALRIADYLKREPSRVMVVLAGGAHAMKQGIPWQMAKYGDFDCRVVLPGIEGLFATEVTFSDADYFIDE